MEAEPVGSLENSDNLEEHADIPLCGLNGNQRVSDDASNAGEEPVEADREKKSQLGMYNGDIVSAICNLGFVLYFSVYRL